MVLSRRKTPRVSYAGDLKTAYAITRKSLKYKKASLSGRILTSLNTGLQVADSGWEAEGTETGKCEIMKIPPKTEPPMTINQI